MASETLAMLPYPEQPKKPWGQHLSERSWPGLTPESLAAWQTDVKQWMAECKRVQAANIETAARAHATLTSAGFPAETKTTVVRRGARKVETTRLAELLRSMVPPMPSGALYGASDTSAESWLRAEEKQQRDREESQRKSKYRDEAIAWLLARGKVYGADFTADDAIATANGIAAEEEIARRLKAGGPFNFAGRNCDDCTGWDGESRRCSCGNRRVSWVTDEMRFDGGYVYAEAY